MLPLHQGLAPAREAALREVKERIKKTKTPEGASADGQRRWQDLHKQPNTCAGGEDTCILYKTRQDASPDEVSSSQMSKWLSLDTW